MAVGNMFVAFEESSTNSDVSCSRDQTRFNAEEMRLLH